jgi:hypothetical protein
MSVEGIACGQPLPCGTEEKQRTFLERSLQVAYV